MSDSKLYKYRLEIDAYCNHCLDQFENSINRPCHNYEECEITDYKKILNDTQPIDIKHDALKQTRKTKCKTCKANCYLEKSLPMCKIEIEIDSYCIHKRFRTISNNNNK